MLNKSFITNAISVLLLAIGLYLTFLFKDDSTHMFYLLGKYITSAGIFALSGAITNWLAVFMLFERIPFLYGSGVIPNNFIAFKSAIREMMLNNFFSEKNFDLAVHNMSKELIDVDKIISQIDENDIFDAVAESVQSSPLGSMLNMFGGAAILEKLRDPFNQRMREKITMMAQDIDFHQAIDTHMSYESMRGTIETMIDKRLDELTETHVKEIISEMIRTHLGWLVVWGGCFGALIGILYELAKILL